MRVAFLIERRNYYRLFGPIVDRALERGWETECWHDCGQPRTGPKRLEFPDADAVPTFRHGRPRVRTYRGSGELVALLAAAPSDVVIAMRRPTADETAGRVRWFGLQYTLDVADLIDRTGATRYDGLGLHSPWWRQRTPDCLRIIESNRARAAGTVPEPVDDAAVADTLARRATLVGIPELDQCHWIDAAGVRRRLGLEPGRPVVLYIPFQFRSIEPRTFWLRHVNRRGRLWQQAAVWLSGRREYQPYVDGHWCDRGVVGAVRAFCDANGAALVVKTRAKDTVPRYLARCADRVFGDDAYYPAVILELLKISSLCVITCLSTVTYEAAYLGVPSVCVAPSGDDLGFWPIWQEWFLNTDPGGSFNFRGVVYARGLGEFVEGFARSRIADYPLEPAARAQYVEKFVGFDDGKSSDRVLDAAQSLIEGAAGGEAAGVRRA
jgi:plasmid stabilization system protein ParE